MFITSPREVQICKCLYHLLQWEKKISFPPQKKFTLMLTILLNKWLSYLTHRKKKNQCLRMWATYMNILLGVSFWSTPMYLTAKRMHSIKICSLWQVFSAKILKQNYQNLISRQICCCIKFTKQNNNDKKPQPLLGRPAPPVATHRRLPLH